MIGSLTSYIDVAQMTLYAFWVFFAGVVYYCHREDKREGYPLEAQNMRGRTLKEGFPFVPRPKTFRLFHGGTVQAPNPAREREPFPGGVRPVSTYPGSPLQPTGDPMRDAVGPGSFALRRDEPEAMIDGTPMIVPMRLAHEIAVDVEDADPRGMAVVGDDGLKAGVVMDIWIDLAEPQIRYLELAVATAAGSRQVMLPMGFAKVSRRRRQVTVKSILARHFADVPAIRSPDRITKLEEDRIMAYYGAGHLYAKPSRLGPLL